MSYNRRKGIDWQNDLYHNLLSCVVKNNIIINENTHHDISSDQLRNLSTTIFPQYGNRKSYQDQVRSFLQYHFATIESDVTKVEHSIELINAPKLQGWLDYKEKVSKAMCLESIRQHTSIFLEDFNYKIPLNIRKEILSIIYCNIEDKFEEKLNMKTLNNCLSFNRTELCDSIKLAMNNSYPSHDDTINQNDFFRGFTEGEITASLVDTNKLNDIQNKLGSVLNSKANEVPIEINSLDDVDSQLLSSNRRHSKYRKIRKRAVGLDNKAFEPVLEFFEKEDSNNNNQVSLIKKLIIFNCFSKNNGALVKYMQGSGRIKREIKKTILESIYDVENIEDNHYSLLDLLVVKRYLIKQKVREVETLLKKTKINVQKLCEGMATFSDVELTFYEEYQKVSVTKLYN